MGWHRLHCLQLHAATRAACCPHHRFIAAAPAPASLPPTAGAAAVAAAGPRAHTQLPALQHTRQSRAVESAPVHQQLALHVLADRGAALNHFDDHVLPRLLVARQVHLPQRGAEELAHRGVVPASGAKWEGARSAGRPSWRRQQLRCRAAGGLPPAQRRAPAPSQGLQIACLWPRKGQAASTLEVAPSPPISVVLSVVVVFLRSRGVRLSAGRAGAGEGSPSQLRHPQHPPRRSHGPLAAIQRVPSGLLLALAEHRAQLVHCWVPPGTGACGGLLAAPPGLLAGWAAAGELPDRLISAGQQRWGHRPGEGCVGRDTTSCTLGRVQLAG